MFFRTVFIAICVLCLPLSLTAEEVAPVTVTEMVFCRGIDDRNPVGVAVVFPETVGRVFCHTRLASTIEHTSISHVWYFEDTQMAIVDLPVDAKSWRTWSSKRIVGEWQGVWRVDVISATGAVIYSDEFVVIADAQ